jgi:hypothetical protein
MDRILRAEIMATVRQAMTEVLEGADEVWLSPEEFCKQFGMFSPEWLRRNGELLPREKAGVVMDDGSVKETRSWAYPKHRINRMIMEGRLREIKTSGERPA